jgi:hypothetical protein
MEQHPDFRFEIDGYPDCPSDHGYINDDERICEKMNYDCAACWNRSVKYDKS